MKKELGIFNYSIKNSSDGNHLDVYIDGYITDAETQDFIQRYWGDTTSVSFKSIRKQINDSGAKSITFWVNSFGGHVGDAMAIHDWIVELDNNPEYTIKTRGIGMVCSAATYIVSAAKDSEVTKNSWYMIHNVSGGVWGDVNTIENYAKTMRKFNDTIAAFYSDLTGKSTEQINEWMNAETWFTGPETAENGFVSKCTGVDVEFKNTIDPEYFHYRNQSALTAYNSFVGKPPKPTENSDETVIFNDSNMNKLVQAIVDAFKVNNLIPNPKPAGEGEGEGSPENSHVEPLTEESLTNALTQAVEGFDISEMVDNRLNEMFKDGLPENIQNALGTFINTTIDEKNKEKDNNFAESEDFKNLKKEVETIQTQIENNVGGAKPRGGEQPSDDYDHDGVTWGGEK